MYGIWKKRVSRSHLWAFKGVWMCVCVLFPEYIVTSWLEVFLDHERKPGSHYPGVRVAMPVTSDVWQWCATPKTLVLTEPPPRSPDQGEGVLVGGADCGVLILPREPVYPGLPASQTATTTIVRTTSWRYVAGTRGDNQSRLLLLPLIQCPALCQCMDTCSCLRLHNTATPSSLLLSLTDTAAHVSQCRRCHRSFPVWGGQASQALSVTIDENSAPFP